MATSFTGLKTWKVIDSGKDQTLIKSLLEKKLGEHHWLLVKQKDIVAHNTDSQEILISLSNSKHLVSVDLSKKTLAANEDSSCYQIYKDIDQFVDNRCAARQND